MATRAEEFANLQTISKAIKRQEKLVSMIKSNGEEIDRRRGQELPSYPKYVPAPFTEVKSDGKDREGLAWKVVSWIYILLALATCVISGVFEGYEVSVVAVALVCGFAGIPTLGVGWVLAKGGFLKKRSLVGTVGVMFSMGVFSFLTAFIMTKAEFEGEAIELAGKAFYWVCVLGALFISAGITFIIAVPLAKRKQCLANEQAGKRAHEEYLRAEEKSFAEYQRARDAAEPEYAKKREKMREEICAAVEVLQTRIAAWKEEYQEMQRVLEQTPGLAMQDKNDYTVSILISYFERGRADSIKEALNLFETEERQNAAVRAAEQAARERNWAIREMERKQQQANAEWLENQRRHNERIEEDARKAYERIERELNRYN